ncbi:DUF6126 family protein [Streptomyces sp. 71268]|uniref:DUF6126 family protein n=1 Tax=Streptomyces sp. 71268 TaxID=3002640 RepID=UPI0023F79CDF|nr:DUF6126 family protein [Streptomyces sp. 71268]WEV24732.1 DUF6126 family protein [Streptomyces sp. 71268]
MSDRTPHAENPRSAQPPTDRPAGAGPAAPETGAVSGPGDAAASAPEPPVRPEPVESGQAAAKKADRAAMNEEDRAPWGLTIRVTFYLVGVHIFAAFLFLLFHLGAK